MFFVSALAATVVASEKNDGGDSKDARPAALPSECLQYFGVMPSQLVPKHVLKACHSPVGDRAFPFTQQPDHAREGGGLACVVGTKQT